MMSAPPASPEYVAIQPAWRPITSTTITRSWLSAVVCSRSIASVAICTAVWNPNVKSVAERSLSIVFGHADDLHAVGAELVRDAERVLAADRDQRVDPVARERREHAARRRRRSCTGSCATCRGSCRRAGAARAREPTREVHRLAVDHAAPAVAEADDLVAVHAFALADDGADHRVEPGAVAAAGQHADAHATSSSIVGSGRCPILPRVRAVRELATDSADT